MLRPVVVPTFAAEILQVSRRFFGERLRKRELDAFFDDAQAAHGIDRLAGVADAVKARDPSRIALPFAEARDVKLSILGIEMSAHARRGEFQWKPHYAALHLAVRELLLQNQEEARLAVRFVQEFALERSPFLTGDPDLPPDR